MLDGRYGALESDFQRFYRLDVGDVYTGVLSPRKAARLAVALPPEAAIHRGDSLDEQFMSLEARLLRHLFNVWVDEKDRMGTVDEYVEKAEKDAKNRERNEARALQALARQRALGEV